MNEITLESPVVFVWDESCNFIKEIHLTSDELALDVDKDYEIIFRECSK